MPTIIGLDLGTSSFKASAYCDTGEHLGTLSRRTPWRSATFGSELEPVEFTSVVRSLVDACAAIARSRVVAIGVTGMAETTFVETDDSVVHPARAWNVEPRRPPVLPDVALFARTGLLDAARTTAVELRRFTDAGRVVRSWNGLPEYAVQVLGGSAVAERSLAARSGFIDVLTGGWSAPLMRWAAVADAVVPPLWPAGRAAGVADLAGACAGAVLTVAGHDHVVAALGAGAADDATVFDSLGTGEALIAWMASGLNAPPAEHVARFTDAGFNVGLGLDEHDVIALAGLGTGNRLNLLLGALADNGFDRQDVLRAEARPSGDPEAVGATLNAEAAEFVDVLGGPDWRHLEGRAPAIVRRTAPDLATARILWWAAVARVTRNAREKLVALGKLSPRATRRVAAGGWFGNAGIREVRERMLGPFELPPVGESGTRGAALLAGLAAGVYATRADFPSLAGKGATG
jgi:sugar (pentulose or hexulose) kinase